MQKQFHKFKLYLELNLFHISYAMFVCIDMFVCRSWIERNFKFASMDVSKKNYQCASRATTSINFILYSNIGQCHIQTLTLCDCTMHLSHNFKISMLMLLPLPSFYGWVLIIVTATKHLHYHFGPFQAHNNSNNSVGKWIIALYRAEFGWLYHLSIIFFFCELFGHLCWIPQNGQTERVFFVASSKNYN